MKDTTMTAKEALATARAIADMAKMGGLTYDTAKAKAMPYIDIVNARGREIAKQYGKRYTPLSFTRLLRM